ncbi:MAG: Ribosomal RNA large subunit methyltransferase H [uncultured bacterium]|nr:MAG: Ribosomal RNA large subunit methyltransferase H [uncultured bacterium]KKT02570.1 MAG: hypothetical protein UV80_C0002G0037 [Candidatus Peregrinibacteria bacterium GW2011_GWF2_43_17]KKT20566.1 MAG: Ribosomal RNA large subunit methyltransferase H [Candidatus Peregrinibacteria bacterium GW2011_GWA2_43_8]
MTILKVGKLKSEYIEIESEFVKRLRPFANLEIKTFKESALLSKSIPKDAFVIVLDTGGKQFSSEEFSKIISKEKDFGSGHIVFVIGGPYGLNEALPSNLKLSFSRMTFTHQYAYIILLEQIYRAFTILIGKNYHH